MDCELGSEIGKSIAGIRENLSRYVGIRSIPPFGLASGLVQNRRTASLSIVSLLARVSRENVSEQSTRDDSSTLYIVNSVIYISRGCNIHK